MYQQKIRRIFKESHPNMKKPQSWKNDAKIIREEYSAAFEHNSESEEGTTVEIVTWEQFEYERYL